MCGFNRDNSSSVLMIAAVSADVVGSAVEGSCEQRDNYHCTIITCVYNNEYYHNILISLVKTNIRCGLF